MKLVSVYKEYPRSGLALKNVSFHLRKGEFAFLIGPSGAGKSTVLRLIHMAERPSDGEVRVSGYSSARMKRRDIPRLRRRVGMVFQNFRLLRDRTAAENLSFALEVSGARRGDIKGRVQRLLAQVGLAARAGAYPDELSGGEQQRIAMARALIHDPVVLLADEPMGNLDERASRGVFDLIRDINSSGTAVLMATHDLELVRRYSGYRVIELSEGAVVYDSEVADAVS
ncbi:MAG: cell division ATP-binding protein FtsE [Gemmatimonadetes bacterium]|uniref:Cell division ATP-binding protein FtsE n=1 Tax=Candidatus Kutchimonas denitrificans TaxID=3056748 RepID=A0AAE4ZB37_9BACT|nr:cell division ATP-binding protein FtsE [Gemmatimonadota bacterium]NIR75561.1 cell division ATP-binding protein FtsE [Candidatus Kutchimonas denitrificans]NIS01875.1 cell division ATP-binding protein FtsE [Gemmatimonadota bacterium]NIT67656.1 cell division ATP-binding protein FtsE [Gemmatimonadota bacterium]NIU53530.1 cell division ATP-binding protein FtsE [Gemmatimonadota bacterium]